MALCGHGWLLGQRTASTQKQSEASVVKFYKMRTALDPRAPQHNPKFSINHFNIIQDGTWAGSNIPQSYQLPHHQAIQMSRIPRKPSEYLRTPPEYPPNTPRIPPEHSPGQILLTGGQGYSRDVSESFLFVFRRFQRVKLSLVTV